MKHIFITSLFISFFVSINSFASDCMMNLLSPEQADSKHYQYFAEDFGDDENPSSRAKNAVQALVKDICKIKTSLNDFEAQCSTPFKDMPHICHVEAKDIGGYFLVMTDYVDGLNIIFNRFD